MKKGEIRMIIIILIVGLVIIGVMLATRGNKKEGNESKKEEEESYAEVLEDGTRINTSNKTQKVKKVEGLEISNLQVTEKDNVTTMLGTVTNKSNETKKDITLKIKIKDKEGKEITTVDNYIGKLEPGKSTQLNSSTTFDYVEMYDYEVTIEK